MSEFPKMTSLIRKRFAVVAKHSLPSRSPLSSLCKMGKLNSNLARIFTKFRSVPEKRFAYSGDSHVYIFERVSDACRLYGVIPFTGSKAQNGSAKEEGKDLTDAYVTQKEAISGVVRGTIFE